MGCFQHAALLLLTGLVGWGEGTHVFRTVPFSVSEYRETSDRTALFKPSNSTPPMLAVFGSVSIDFFDIDVRPEALALQNSETTSSLRLAGTFTYQYGSITDAAIRDVNGDGIADIVILGPTFIDTFQSKTTTTVTDGDSWVSTFTSSGLTTNIFASHTACNRGLIAKVPREAVRPATVFTCFTEDLATGGVTVSAKSTPRFTMDSTSTFTPTTLARNDVVLQASETGDAELVLRQDANRVCLASSLAGASLATSCFFNLNSIVPSEDGLTSIVPRVNLASFAAQVGDRLVVRVQYPVPGVGPQLALRVYSVTGDTHLLHVGASSWLLSPGWSFDLSRSYNAAEDFNKYPPIESVQGLDDRVLGLADFNGDGVDEVVTSQGVAFLLRVNATVTAVASGAKFLNGTRVEELEKAQASIADAYTLALVKSDNTVVRKTDVASLTGQTSGTLVARASATSPWRPLCSTGWTIANAMVACRELGFAATVSTTSFAGAALPMTSAFSSEFALETVGCEGNEFVMAQCTGASTLLEVSTQCFPGMEVQVTCDAAVTSYVGPLRAGEPVNRGQLRLVDSSIASSGTLQIYDGTAWGYVCDTGFDAVAAGVACRQLGFDRSLAFSGSTPVSTTSTSFALDSVMCSGLEPSLLLCTTTPGANACTNVNGVNLVCTGTAPANPSKASGNSTGTATNAASVALAAELARQTPKLAVAGSVRLIGGPSASSGFVQVSNGSVWGFVNPPTDFSLLYTAAEVVCRSVGRSIPNTFSSGGSGGMPVDPGQAIAAPLSLRSGTYGQTYAMRMPVCTGGEQTLADCPQAPSSVAPGQTAFASTSPNQVFLAICGEKVRSSGTTPNSQSTYSATIAYASAMRTDLTALRGSAHTVFDADISGNGDPVVASDMLVSHAAYAFAASKFGERAVGSHSWVAHVQPNVIAASMVQFNDPLYNAVSAAGSINQATFEYTSPLPGGIRLSNGDSGYVEVRTLNEWKPVCDVGFDAVEGTVVCRQLGFDTLVRATTGFQYGPRDASSVIGNVACTGSELALVHCPIAPTTACTGLAGVVCNSESTEVGQETEVELGANAEDLGLTATQDFGTVALSNAVQPLKFYLDTSVVSGSECAFSATSPCKFSPMERLTMVVSGTEFAERYTRMLWGQSECTARSFGPDKENGVAQPVTFTCTFLRLATKNLTHASPEVARMRVDSPVTLEIATRPDLAKPASIFFRGVQLQAVFPTIKSVAVTQDQASGVDAIGHTNCTGSSGCSSFRGLSFALVLESSVDMDALSVPNVVAELQSTRAAASVPLLVRTAGKVGTEYKVTAELRTPISGAKTAAQVQFLAQSMSLRVGLRMAYAEYFYFPQVPSLDLDGETKAGVTFSVPALREGLVDGVRAFNISGCTAATDGLAHVCGVSSEPRSVSFLVRGISLGVARRAVVGWKKSPCRVTSAVAVNDLDIRVQCTLTSPLPSSSASASSATVPPASTIVDGTDEYRALTDAAPLMVTLDADNTLENTLTLVSAQTISYTLPTITNVTVLPNSGCTRVDSRLVRCAASVSPVFRITGTGFASLGALLKGSSCTPIASGQIGTSTFVDCRMDHTLKEGGELTPALQATLQRQDVMDIAVVLGNSSTTYRVASTTRIAYSTPAYTVTASSCVTVTTGRYTCVPHERGTVTLVGAGSFAAGTEFSIDATPCVPTSVTQTSASEHRVVCKLVDPMRAVGQDFQRALMEHPLRVRVPLGQGGNGRASEFSTFDAASGRFKFSCPTGMVASGNATQGCTMCPMGQYALLDSTTAASACAVCPVGSFCPRGADRPLEDRFAAQPARDGSASQTPPIDASTLLTLPGYMVAVVAVISVASAAVLVFGLCALSLKWLTPTGYKALTAQLEDLDTFAETYPTPVEYWIHPDRLKRTFGGVLYVLSRIGVLLFMLYLVVTFFMANRRVLQTFSGAEFLPGISAASGEVDITFYAPTHVLAAFDEANTGLVCAALEDVGAVDVDDFPPQGQAVTLPASVAFARTLDTASGSMTVRYTNPSLRLSTQVVCRGPKMTALYLSAIKWTLRDTTSLGTATITADITPRNDRAMTAQARESLRSVQIITQAVDFEDETRNIKHLGVELHARENSVFAVSHVTPAQVEQASEFMFVLTLSRNLGFKRIAVTQDQSFTAMLSQLLAISGAALTGFAMIAQFSLRFSKKHKAMVSNAAPAKGKGDKEGRKKENPIVELGPARAGSSGSDGSGGSRPSTGPYGVDDSATRSAVPAFPPAGPSNSEAPASGGKSSRSGRKSRKGKGKSKKSSGPPNSSEV